MLLQYFSGSSTHKVDAKGRVSIPAGFRKVLDAEQQPGVVLIPGLRLKPAIEGFGYGFFEKMAKALDRMNPLAPATIALANKLMGQARHIQLEDTGRIVLPQDLREMLGNPGEALFVGMGRTFQLWNPAQHAARQPEMESMFNEHFDDFAWPGAEE
jgi:MraZ protein